MTTVLVAASFVPNQPDSPLGILMLIGLLCFLFCR
jgi:hypothetical protein